MRRNASAARYMGKMEEATEKLFQLEEFRVRHGAEGKPLEDLEQKYANDVIAYGTLVGHLAR